MSLATVMLFGCATATKLNQAEINKHPITKVCIQDDRHSPLTNYIKEAVDNLGIQTEVYKVDNNLNPSDDALIFCLMSTNMTDMTLNQIE